MKIPDHAKKPLVTKRKLAYNPNSIPKKTAFTLACEAAGHKSSTIKKRMEADPDLTLEEALAIPVASRTECGRVGAARCKANGGDLY